MSVQEQLARFGHSANAGWLRELVEAARREERERIADAFMGEWHHDGESIAAAIRALGWRKQG